MATNNSTIVLQTGTQCLNYIKHYHIQKFFIIKFKVVFWLQSLLKINVVIFKFVLSCAFFCIFS